MSVELTAVESRSALSKEQIIANRLKTQALLRAALIYKKHEAFKGHMENNPVQQNFDGCVELIIRLVRNQSMTVSDLAPTLIVLLQNGAAWNIPPTPVSTPYHVVCGGTGDHQELLKLMINKLGRKLINAKDEEDCTALICAVKNANIKCAETLIANGADVNLMKFQNSYPQKIAGVILDSWSPLIDAINMLHPKSRRSPKIMMDMFDLLLGSGADVNMPCHYHQRTPVMYAAAIGNVECVEKLIEKGTRLSTVDKTGRPVWAFAAKSGNVYMLKYFVEKNYIHKNSIDAEGSSVLYWAVRSGNIDAVRYLLILGATLTTYIPQERVELCWDCKTYLQKFCGSIPLSSDPGMRAIVDNLPEVVRLLDEHGCQMYKHPVALIYAIRMERVEVVEYLLRSHKYPMNYEYARKEWNTDHSTFLTEACQSMYVNIIELLLEHGADPNKRICAKKYPYIISRAITLGHVENIARFIRGGVNVNTRFCNIPCVDLPFEAAVLHNHIRAAKMLLVFGCSPGVTSLENNHMIKAYITREMQELLKEWNVYKNNVLPLKQRCRMVILNHLCPQADKKIKELPLPPQIIKYLNIPELDDILETINSNP